MKYSSFSSMVLCGVGISWWTIESSFMPNADWLNWWSPEWFELRKLERSEFDDGPKSEYGSPGPVRPLGRQSVGLKAVCWAILDSEMIMTQNLWLIIYECHFRSKPLRVFYWSRNCYILFTTHFNDSKIDQLKFFGMNFIK